MKNKDLPKRRVQMNALGIFSIFFLILSAGTPVRASPRPPCALTLHSVLKGMTPMDADAITRKIESGNLGLKRIEDQGVAEVTGLPEGQGIILRKNFHPNLPADGAVERHSFNIRTRPNREVALYQLDRELGLDLVPETRLSTLNGETVSLQRKMSGREFRSPEEYVRYIRERVKAHPEKLLEHKKDLERLATLDLVGGSMDRNISNFLYDESRNRIIAIDNADSMPVVEKNTGVIWFWNPHGVGLDQMMERETRARILALDPGTLTEKMQATGLLEPEALEQMRIRIRMMKDYVEDHPLASMTDLGKAIDRNIVNYQRFPRR